MSEHDDEVQLNPPNGDNFGFLCLRCESLHTMSANLLLLFTFKILATTTTAFLAAHVQARQDLTSASVGTRSRSTHLLLVPRTWLELPLMGFPSL